PQPGARSFDDDLADLEDVGARGMRKRQARVLLDDEDRHAATTLHLLKRLEDHRHPDRRGAERRLVEQEELRSGHHRAAEREHLLLPAGECSGLLVEAALQLREELEDAPGLVLDVAASRIPAETQVFPDRELAEGPATLRNVRDSRARGRLRTTRQLLPGEHHVAAAA